MKFLKIAEKILPLLFWVFLIFAFDTPRFAVLTVFAAVLHEIGHVCFGISRGIVRLFPTPHPSGFRIKEKKISSYKDELILLLGGPVSNLLVFLVFLPIYFYLGSSLAFDIAFINLLTAISNLLPVRGYDGYRIIENLLLLKSRDSVRAVSPLSRLSFFFSSLLLLLSLYLLLKLGEGYWIFGIFFVSLYPSLKNLCENNIF